MNDDTEIGRRIRELIDAGAPPLTADETRSRPYQATANEPFVGGGSNNRVRALVAVAAVALILAGGWYVVKLSPRNTDVNVTGGPVTPSGTGPVERTPGTAGLQVPTAPFPTTAAQWDAYATAHHPSDAAIDFAKYNDAVSASIECMRSQGVPVTGPIPSPSGRFVWYTYAGINVDQIAVSCRALAETEAAKLWTIKSSLTQADYDVLQSEVDRCESKDRQLPGSAPTEIRLACTKRGERDALSRPNS